MVPAATSYKVEIGNTLAGSELGGGTAEGATSFRWSPAPSGSFFFRVRPMNAAGTGPPSNTIQIDSPDPRDVIAGLFLSAGPLRTASGNVGCRAGIMAGWSPGSHVQILVSTKITGTNLSAVRDTAAQVEDVTQGAVTAFLQPVDGVLPPARDGQISLDVVDDARVDQICGKNFGGCAQSLGVPIRSANVYVRPNHSTTLLAHELGHAALGLCHMQAKPPDFGINPIMSVAPDGQYWGNSSRLTEVEMEAVKAVYAAGMRPGSTLGQFVNAGLARSTAVGPPVRLGSESLVVN
jgi:hypothetical protein